MGAQTRIKLTIVGDGASGKTCLLIVFKEDVFPKAYVPTVFENYVKYLTVKEKQVELVLWDSAGQEDYDSIRPLCYPATDVVLLCYSVDSRESFQNIPNKWSDELKWYCPKIPVLLVALKKDLRGGDRNENKTDIGEGKQLASVDYVTPEEGRKMAESINVSGFFECSSLKREGIQEIFDSAISTVLRRRKKIKNRIKKFMCLTTL